MANELNFSQISTVLNDVVQQATGTKTIAPVDTASFVTAAQTALKTGYDPVMNALSQVLSRSIFSIRPYSRKFKGLEVSESAYGNQVRKFSIADKDIQDDDRYKHPVAFDSSKENPIGDGMSVDMMALNKPKILQTNFYGANVFSDSYTIFKDQIDCAFTSPDEFARFISMVSTNMMDKLEQARENIARATVANFIGGIIHENNDSRVIHLLSEYNTLTGQTLTAQTVYLPANFRSFMQWVYSRIATICSMFTERSNMFQTVVNEMRVNRHTPYADQKIYIYAPAMYQSTMMAIADTYHDNFLTMGDNEVVNFWQSIDTPDSIKVNPVYTGTNGALVKPTGESPKAAVEQAGIFGVIFDRNAMGYATTQQWSSATPFNSRGGYTNFWFHETERNWTDNTEKGVVLLLD